MTTAKPTNRLPGQTVYSGEGKEREQRVLLARLAVPAATLQPDIFVLYVPPPACCFRAFCTCEFDVASDRSLPP